MIRKEGNTIGINNSSMQLLRTTHNLISLEEKIQRILDSIRILGILEIQIAPKTVFPLKISFNSMKRSSESSLKTLRTSIIMRKIRRKIMKKQKKLVLKKINSFIMMWNLIFSVTKKILTLRISLKILGIQRRMKGSLSNLLVHLLPLVLQKKNEKKVKILLHRFT